MPTLRTLIPPRRPGDAYSFFGTGRWQYQRAVVDPKDGQLKPTEPVHDGAPVPLRG